MADKGSKDIFDTGWFPLSVGVFFALLGLFVPDIGIIHKGLLTPMILFVGFGGLFIFVGITLLKDRKYDHNSTGEQKIIKQSPGDALLLIPASLMFAICATAILCSLFIPEGGIYYYGFDSELVIMFIFGIGFLCVDIVLFVGGFMGISKRILYKKLKLDSTMFTTTATYADDEVFSDELIGDLAAYKPKPIKYKYIDETGTTRFTTSVQEYSLTERKKFSKMKTFKIRCKGKYSIILNQEGY